MNKSSETLSTRLSALTFLVIAKRKKGVEASMQYLKQLCPNVHVVFGQTGEPFPREYFGWSGDFLISYMSPWIIPKKLLDRARIGSINFHPGPPQYPGVGCTNFALYNCEKDFGVTAHKMEAKVDSGTICAVRRFPIYPDDTVLSLTNRCYDHIEELFRFVIAEYEKTGRLPISNETWTGKPYTRKQLNDLCRITYDMSEQEIMRRVLATTYPGMPGPFIELFGHRFELTKIDSKSTTSL